MMILSAWNEHDEGHWIEPALAKYGGDEKLVAIRKAIDKAEARRDAYWARVAGQAQESAQEEQKETAMKHDDGLGHALVPSPTLPAKVSRMDATVPVPTAAQLRYQRNEISALIHFNMGTYACASGTGYSGCRECWLGNAANASRNCAEVAGPGQLARTFNPTQLSTDNWAESIVALGARAAVLTAKHDSGHLLWPTNVTLPGGVEYTYAVGHSESAIQVDVLRLFTESMQRHGLGHGFYYSIGNNVYLNVKNAVLQTGHTDHSGESLDPLPGMANVTQQQFEAIALAHLRELWTGYGSLTEM